MAVRVVCFWRLPTSIVPVARHDYNANKFIGALKGEPINGYARIVVGIQRIAFKRATAIQHLTGSENAAEYVKQKNKARPLAFSPIPSSQVRSGWKVVSSTYRLARQSPLTCKTVSVLDGGNVVQPRYSRHPVHHVLQVRGDCLR